MYRCNIYYIFFYLKVSIKLKKIEYTSTILIIAGVRLNELTAIKMKRSSSNDRTPPRRSRTPPQKRLREQTPPRHSRTPPRHSRTPPRRGVNICPGAPRREARAPRTPMQPILASGPPGAPRKRIRRLAPPPQPIPFVLPAPHVGPREQIG